MWSIFLFCLHFIFSIYMLGIIWFVQLVHYPIFSYLNYDPKHNPFIFHQTRSALAIMAPMLIELISASILIFVPYPYFFAALILLIFTLLIWLSTFTLQVPAHNLLRKEKNEDVIERLVLTNWFRTALWSLKAIYLFFLIWQLLTETLITIS